MDSSDSDSGEEEEFMSALSQPGGDGNDEDPYRSAE